MTVLQQQYKVATSHTDLPPSPRPIVVEIPLGVQTIAVADTYQAMTSDRSYRKGQGQDTALTELKCCAGS